MDEQNELSSTYLRQMFSSKLFNLNRRVLQLDDTLTTISDKLADMDKRAEQVAKVVRESSLAEGAIEALMRRNSGYALFVLRAAENFLAEQMRWSDNERDCLHTNPAEQDPAHVDQQNEESYRSFAEEDIYGYHNDGPYIRMIGDREDQYRKYLGLLWSLTGQKFRRRKDSDSDEDGLSCCGGGWKWCPSGFDLVDILGIVYQSMPQDEELRRLFTRVIDAEMLRRKAQQDAESEGKDATTVSQDQTCALIDRIGTSLPLHQRREDEGSGAEVSRDYDPATSGDLEHRGGVGRGKRGGGGGRGGRAGGGKGGQVGREGEAEGERCDRNVAIATRSCLHYESMERGVSNSCQTKRRPTCSGNREGSKEGRIATVAGRRAEGRLNSRKSECVGVNINKRLPMEEGRLKRQKKKTEPMQENSRRAVALTKTTVPFPEGQLQGSYCPPLARDDVGAAGEFSDCHRSKRGEPSLRSSVSYTICTSPLGNDMTIPEQDARWDAEDGADGPRTMKSSGRCERAPVI